jgi:hypothetical protein
LGARAGALEIAIGTNRHGDVGVAVEKSGRR